MSKYSTDEGLFLEELRKGSKKAFAELVEVNSETIYRVAFRMLNDEQDAEDVLQETFIKAFHNLPSFEGRSQLSTWLYRIAVNEALMMIRKRKPATASIDQEYEADDGDLIPRQAVDWCCLPEAELMTGESQAKISQAVESLSTANRAVFILRDLSGLSTRDTAETLNISEAAVKTRLLRARLELREQLSGYFSGRLVIS
jgi:RNA polymerase sigma-70 factor (ECF subfamily)